MLLLTRRLITGTNSSHLKVFLDSFNAELVLSPELRFQLGIQSPPSFQAYFRLTTFGLALDLNKVPTKDAHQSTVGSLITEQEKEKKETGADGSEGEPAGAWTCEQDVRQRQRVEGETSPQPGRSVQPRCERQRLLPAALSVTFQGTCGCFPFQP